MRSALWSRSTQTDDAVADATEAEPLPVEDLGVPTGLTSEADAMNILGSLSRSQAVIEFEPDGTILWANDNFCGAMGYHLDQIVGQHHRIFVDPVDAAMPAYLSFWDSLRNGHFQSAEYRRLGNGGREIFIQATYNPVFDDAGKVMKVVKFATDITSQRQAQREIQNRTQAVIEFEPDGTIITANDSFLATVGYSLDEIVGQHHRIFMPPGEADTAEYMQFWPSLAAGEFRQGEFRRVDARGNELWLRGAYNPVFGPDGTIGRVVKGVADITAEVHGRAEAGRVGQSIARSVNEMTAAIQEISETITMTADLARGAEEGVEHASAKVAALNSASETIGAVINLITGLSGQTNLLALNATIEAARAGEAGRGFAVVADEVKNLANQTAEAAEGVRQSIEMIQAEIADAAGSIGAIADSVTEVSGAASTVASAVEEQSVVMQQMSHSADELLSLNS